MREAVIHVTDDHLGAIGLDGVVSTLRQAGLQDLTELRHEGIQQVRVAEPIPEAVLSGLEPVDWWETLDESPAGTTYMWKITVTNCQTTCPFTEETIVYEIDAVRDRGIDLSLIGSQAEIGRTIDQLIEAGMHVDLERLGEYRGSASTIDHLTERQREVVRTAHELGYYDVPRTTSTEEVAEAVGVNPSTAAEHLQRAERNLLDNVLVAAD